MTLHALCCNLLPPCQNKVVLYATTERYGDNMRYVAEELLRRGGCEVVWVSERQKVPTPKAIRDVCGRLAMRRELATAHVIVSDARLSKYWLKGYVKKSGQVYIHVRNDGPGIAKAEVDVHSIDALMLQRITEDSRRLDMLFSASRHATELYRGNYRFAGDVLAFGLPRNDLLLKSDRTQVQKKIRERYKLAVEDKVILYIPAKRPWDKARFPSMNYTAVLAALEKRFSGKWVFLVRRDPLLSAKGMRWLLPKGSTAVIDAWDYPDTSELLAAADAVIGDYDNCTYDFLLTGRPAFLYVPDAVEFDKRVGFYDLPGDIPIPTMRDNKSLVNAITTFDEKKFTVCVAGFLRQRGYTNDGQATARVCDVIRKKLSVRLPEFTVTRARILQDTKMRCRRFIYHSVDVDLECRRHIFFGFRWMTLKKPVPPPNPYADLPIQANKIVLVPTTYKYNDNLKYIVEEIRKRKLEYELVWVLRYMNEDYFSSIHTFPDFVKVLIFGTEEADRAISEAKLLIYAGERTSDVIRGLTKKQDQIYIQLWHGSFGIKANPLFGKVKVWGKLAEKQVDFLIANSDFEAKKVYRKWFFLRGRDMNKVKKLGHPRNDILFANNKDIIRKKIYEIFGIPDRKKLLLYAPTWRDDWDTSWLDLDYVNICHSLSHRFGGEWIIAYRAHFLSALKEQKFNETSCTLNVSDYDDIQELIVASDACISDYSSCICDFMLTRKPIFLYVPDYRRYEKKTRGLLYPLEKTPCPIAKSNVELCKKIENFDITKYRYKLEKFLNWVGCVEDGHAAERVTDLIEQLAPAGRRDA